MRSSSPKSQWPIFLHVLRHVNAQHIPWHHVSLKSQRICYAHKSFPFYDFQYIVILVVFQRLLMTTKRPYCFFHQQTLCAFTPGKCFEVPSNRCFKFIIILILYTLRIFTICGSIIASFFTKSPNTFPAKIILSWNSCLVVTSRMFSFNDLKFIKDGGRMLKITVFKRKITGA